MTKEDDPKHYRVLLAEDHALLRQSLKAYLESQGLCKVIGQAQDGREAMRLYGELRPDIVLMDVSMPVLDGGAPPGAAPCDGAPIPQPEDKDDDSWRWLRKLF